MSIDFATYSKFSGILIAGATLDNCKVFYPFRTADEYVQIFWQYNHTTLTTLYIGINERNILDFDIKALETVFSTLAGQNTNFGLEVYLYTFPDVTLIHPYQLLYEFRSYTENLKLL